jgi:nucleotide-binding universal stress UspA family protein
MTLPKTILVPIDFSEPSNAALDYAVELAKKLGAKIHVLTAFQLPIVGFPDGVYVASPDIAEKLTTAAQTALDEAISKRKNSGVEITGMLEQADPRDAIVRAAEDLQADLIVMATHGRKGIARALIGSTTEAVVRTAKVPVLTVHMPKPS